MPPMTSSRSTASGWPARRAAGSRMCCATPPASSSSAAPIRARPIRPAQGATLRGLGGNASSRALVLLDGVPQVDPFGGWVSFAAFDPRRLGLVRVTRGGGSGVYGLGRARRHDRADRAPGRGELAPVSRGRRLWQPRLGRCRCRRCRARSAAASRSLSASYARGDGFMPIVAAQRGPADRPGALRAGEPRRARGRAGRRRYRIAGERPAAARPARRAAPPSPPTATSAPTPACGSSAAGDWGWEALAYLQMRQFSSGFASVNAARTTVIADARSICRAGDRRRRADRAAPAARRRGRAAARRATRADHRRRDARAVHLRRRPRRRGGARRAGATRPTARFAEATLEAERRADADRRRRASIAGGSATGGSSSGR